ncbi:MAG: hypothetical protein K2W82_01230 [Candidatus Obscuribacterales bacterium]|nr:hypothetical protein [Candidatus Obscuribacterales bacterium]
MSPQEKTLVDLPANLIMWTHYLNKGKEYLATNKMTKAILHLNLADQTAFKTLSAAEQIEALNWLTFTYYKTGNGIAAKQCSERLRALLSETSSSQSDISDEYLLLSKAVLFETENNYRHAETAYAWLMANYRQKGMSPYSYEMTILTAHTNKFNKA